VIISNRPSWINHLLQQLNLMRQYHTRWIGYCSTGGVVCDRRADDSATVVGGDPAGGRQAGAACNDLLGFDRVALLFITVGGE